MKIVRIEPIMYFHWLVVRVHTDEGITGIGQTAYWGWPSALIPMIETFSELLKGEDPMRVEHHWARMHRLKPFRGGALSGAVAAVDIALWDIAGKALGVPVHQLLGGRQRDKIRLHVLINGGQTTEDLVSEAERYVEMGITALKFDAFPSGLPESVTYTKALGTVVERVGAVRDAVGWDTDLIVEAWRSFGPGEIITLSAELEPFRLLFLEDPLPPDSADSMGEIARHIRIPIGGGERSHTLHEFRELLTKHSVRFVRPDVGLAGGLSQTRKIATIAEAFHAQVSAHNFFSPLLTAATAHLYAAIPNAAPLEYLEWEEQEPRKDQLLDPLKRTGGYLEIPTKPGLGVTLNEDMIERMPYQPWEAASAPRLRPDGSVYTRS
jgi:galactonate dehydratase